MEKGREFGQEIFCSDSLEKLTGGKGSRCLEDGKQKKQREGVQQRKVERTEAPQTGERKNLT